MNDTVTKILELVSEYAEHYAEDRRWGTFTADTTKARQALQDELTRLFTPLTDEQIATVYFGATEQSLRPQDNVLAHKFARAIEFQHGITGEKNETT